MHAGDHTNHLAFRSALHALRVQIDEVDDRILQLLHQRGKLAADIGKIKQEHGLEAFSPAREDEVLRKALKGDHGPLPARTVWSIFRELMSGCRALQRNRLASVGFVGPESGLGHKAATERFGEMVDYVRFASVSGLLDAIVQGDAEYGVVAIENYGEGWLGEVAEHFLHGAHPAVCAEIRLHSHSQALRRPGPRSTTELARELAFVVISRRANPRTGHDRTAVILQLSASAGPLSDVLAGSDISGTALEPIPLKVTEDNSLVFLSLSGYVDDPPIQRGLERLSRHTTALSVLGSYPTAYVYC